MKSSANSAGQRNGAEMRCNRFARLLVTVACCCLMLSGAVHAQDLCATAVARATKSYEIGRFAEVISILGPCLSEMTTDDKFQAYRLLAIAHLLRDEQGAADAAIESMLKINPRYERNPDHDPAELVQALERYGWYPQFALTARIAGNLTSPFLVRAHSLDPSGTGGGTYSAGVGTSLALGGDFHLTNRIAFSAEIAFLASNFRVNDDAYKLSTSYQENLTYFAFPVLARYEFPFGSLRPMLTAGAFAEVSPNASGSISGNDQVKSTTVSASDLAATSRRPSSNYGFILGGGMQYNVFESMFIVSFRYYHGVKNAALAAQRYSSTDLTNRFYFVDNDFGLRNFELSISYLLPVSYAAEERGEAQ